MAFLTLCHMTPIFGPLCSGGAGSDNLQHSLHPLSEGEGNLCCLIIGDVNVVSDLVSHSEAVGQIDQGLVVVIL